MVKLPDAWSRAEPVFDDEHLVSSAGLAPAMGLGERAGLSQLIAERVAIRRTRVASAAANTPDKITAVVAGIAAGADCIDDLDAVRSSGMSQLFGGVYAAATALADELVK